MRTRTVLKLPDGVGSRAVGWTAVPSAPSLSPEDPAEFRITATERLFVERAVARGATLWRNGWPDFLAERGGKKIAIEVKSQGDRISAAQAKMFAALETVGLDTFVWHPLRPEVLIPWRKYRSIGTLGVLRVREIHGTRHWKRRPMGVSRKRTAAAYAALRATIEEC